MEMKAKFLNLKHFWTLMDIYSKILLIAYWINFKFFFSSSLKTNQQKNNIILICWNSDWYFDKCVKCRWWWNLLKFTKILNKINLKSSPIILASYGSLHEKIPQMAEILNLNLKNDFLFLWWFEWYSIKQLKKKKN